MTAERITKSEAAGSARRTVWAAPFVLLVAVGAGLAMAYPTLRPGTDEAVHAAAPAAVQPLDMSATRVTDSDSSAATGTATVDASGAAAGPLPAARVVTGNARALATEPALPEVDAHGTRVDVTEDATTEAPAAVLVVRGQSHATDPSATGETGAAADAAAVTVAGVSFGLCRETPFIDCVVDGDTFYHRGEPVRIADIDAPEIRTPACLHEAELGARATYRLLALLNAGRFELARPEESLGGNGTDDYGRALRLVLRDGRSLGGTLVGEGLARAWNGPAARWCS